MESMDKIILKDAKYLCQVGITEKERKCKQPIYINMEIYKDLRHAATTDNILDTISYSDVNKQIKELIEPKKHKLIESIAEKVADHVLSHFDITKITVRVKKPEATPYADYAGVQITRLKELE